MGLFRRCADLHDLHARTRSLPHGALDRHEGHGVLHRFGLDSGRSARARPNTASKASPPVRTSDHRHEQPRSGRSGRRATVVPGQVMAAQDAGRLAGSAMHFIMAIVLLAVLASSTACRTMTGLAGLPTSQASAAAELGIEPGDVMLSVGGEEVTGFLQFGDLVRPVGVNSPRSPGNATARSSPIPSSSAVVSPPRARTPSRDSLSATASSRSRAPTSSAGTTSSCARRPGGRVRRHHCRPGR